MSYLAFVVSLSAFRCEDVSVCDVTLKTSVVEIGLVTKTASHSQFLFGGKLTKIQYYI